MNGKHVDALLGRWRNDGLSAGTLKNRMAHLRWWAEKVGKKALIASSNVQFNIPKRVFVTNVSKATEVQDKLGRVSDPYVRASLELQRVFGLHREESIKFQPRYADQGDHLKIKGSWTKGGRERVIPIITSEQRAALDFAHKLVGERSLTLISKGSSCGQGRRRCRTTGGGPLLCRTLGVAGSVLDREIDQFSKLEGVARKSAKGLKF